MPTETWLLLPVLIVEAALGYPQPVYALIAHPVVWMGQLIGWLEQHWNRSASSDTKRRVLGVATVAILLATTIGAGWLIQRLTNTVPYGWIVIVIVATTGLAQRSLYMHARDILVPLIASDLPQSRLALSRIVGRDTAAFDEGAIVAATLESLAESFNDAVVAPAFWFAVGGLPGMLAYKAMNTADSMIGHREPRWRMFGWAAARTDDVLNLIPARIAGVLISIGGWRGLGVMWRDAGKHDSPNAGWPEAAMAGALNVQLGGATTYDGVMHERATFGEGGQPRVPDLVSGMRIYLRACGLLWALAALVGMANMYWQR